jgi:ABC-type sugar transport system substrate-binding protein
MGKMKKLFCLILSLALLLPMLNAAATAAGATTKNAVPTKSTVTVNGSPVAFQAYNIDGANYFKLRDIAKALNGTAKQFEVGYDAAENAIVLTAGKPYTVTGGELVVSGAEVNQPAALSSAKVTLNGSLIQLTAYLIGGNNYFKLRDIGTALGFGVAWNAGTNTIEINTASPSNPGTSDVGFFNPSVNYNAKPKYKIVYMMGSSGVLYDMFDYSFKLWADRMNCSYSSFSAEGDTDLYIEALATYAAQGVDGFILDPDASVYDRVIEVLREQKVPWMPAMATPVDENGRLQHPAVGFDNTAFGVQMATWAIDYAKKTWPNAKESEIGMLSMDFSLSDQVHERTTGAHSVWNQHYLRNNFYTADGALTGDLSEDGGYKLAYEVFAAHPAIKYWLVCAFFDDYALGANDAAVKLGKQNGCVIVNCGGSALIDQWDNGKNSCWKASVFAAQTIFAEPMIGGLYAQMDGQATAETLWTDWIDKKHGEKYAFLNIPTIVLTKDNYQEYLEWVDAYSGFNFSDYSYHGTQFPSRATPPVY